MYTESSSLHQQVSHPFNRCCALSFVFLCITSITLVCGVIALAWALMNWSNDYQQLYEETFRLRLETAVPWYGKACHQNSTNFAVISCHQIHQSHFIDRLDTHIERNYSALYSELQRYGVVWYRQQYDSLLIGVTTYACVLTLALVLSYAILRSSQCVQRRIETHEYSLPPTKLNKHPGIGEVDTLYEEEDEAEFDEMGTKKLRHRHVSSSIVLQ
jgi:hypothetical protein